tara:strand:+ start:157 stop:639 length:483 start_codon:yes stop_codon:yes gene_type:complete
MKINSNSIYNIKINDIDGKLIDMNKFRNKYILIVNVASYCGYTSQYKDLQKLYEQYSNIEIIATPCNQFFFQEPFNEKKIKTFCENRYKITFNITEKIKVKGKNQHDLYKWLTNKDLNGIIKCSVTWNFNKFLINFDGKLIEHFDSNVNPLSYKITQHLI